MKKSTIMKYVLLSMIMLIMAALSPQVAKADNLTDYTVNLYSHYYDTRGSNYSNCPYGGLHTHSDSCKKDKYVTRTTTAYKCSNCGAIVSTCPAYSCSYCGRYMAAKTLPSSACNYAGPDGKNVTGSHRWSTYDSYTSTAKCCTYIGCGKTEHTSHSSSCIYRYGSTGTTYHADKSPVYSNDVLRGTITVKGVSSDPYSNYGGSTISLKTPTRVGYTFKGWYGDNGCSEENPSMENPTISASSSGDKEYTAKWELNTYKISYDLHGGRVDKEFPDEYTVESNDIALPEPTRKGMKFSGWKMK